MNNETKQEESQSNLKLEETNEPLPQQQTMIAVGFDYSNTYYKEERQVTIPESTFKELVKYKDSGSGWGFLMVVVIILGLAILLTG